MRSFDKQMFVKSFISSMIKGSLKANLNFLEDRENKLSMIKIKTTYNTYIFDIKHNPLRLVPNSDITREEAGWYRSRNFRRLYKINDIETIRQRVFQRMQ